MGRLESRRANGKQAVPEQLDPVRSGPFAQPVSQRQIHRSAPKIYRVVGHRMIDRNFRMILPEGADPGDQPESGEGRRRADGQAGPVGGIPDAPADIGDMGEAARQRLRQFCPIQRQFDAPMDTHEKRPAQLAFQRLHLAADRARRDIQLRRGVLHAAVASRGLKGGERCQRRQIVGSSHPVFPGPKPEGEAVSPYE